MDSCYQNKVCNCIKQCKCDNGYECCSQEVPGGKQPIFGLCVAKGTCDGKRGLCSNKKLKSVEHFSENSENNQCYYKDIFMYFPIILVLSLTFIILYLKIKTH
jgi:hypothetical protein